MRGVGEDVDVPALLGGVVVEDGERRVEPAQAGGRGVGGEEFDEGAADHAVRDEGEVGDGVQVDARRGGEGEVGKVRSVGRV
jgi:hypothetical protein